MDSAAVRRRVASTTWPAPRTTRSTTAVAPASNFIYSHAVANGTYTLSLYFAESTYTAVGQRKFDVFAEGAQILNDFDIVQAAGGAKKALIKTFTVTVNDGRIDLSFAGVVGDAMVSGISLVKM